MRRKVLQAFLNASHHKKCENPELDTRQYISQNNHYLIVTTGTISLLLSMGKAFNGMSPSFCDKKVVGQSSLPVVLTQSDERHASRA